MRALSLTNKVIVVVFLAAFQMAAVLRSDNPVKRTQTDAISLKAKLEETKDGIKGAPSPSMQFYGKSEFLLDSPVHNETESAIEKYDLQYENESEDKAYWWTESQTSGNIPSSEKSQDEIEDDSLWWGNVEEAPKRERFSWE